ncbi:MAG TPA: hypothetical protein VFO39_03735 [Candidatus Sulfotelmatobacter sp.]|nr:hypothetical protein [Candidatus Sulfotelmatobacter sp.]
MSSSLWPRVLTLSFGFLFLSALCPSICLGQELTLSTPAPVAAASPFVAAVENVQNKDAPFISHEHKFFDRRNKELFAAVAAFDTADFFTTRANLQNGGRELNPVTRLFGTSNAGLAANFAGQTAGVIGLSYFFHRTGHHKLERALSYVNIAASAGAVSFDLAHR